MPAHLRELPRCLKCGAPACMELFNTRNASQGVYCGRHGDAALREFKFMTGEIEGLQRG